MKDPVSSKHHSWIVGSLLLVLSSSLIAVASIATHSGVTRDASATSRVDDDSDLSELKIAFKLVKGKLRVNRQTSTANFSPRFDSRLSKSLSKTEVINSLFDDIDKALRELNAPYYYSLNDDIRHRIDRDEAFRTSVESDPQTKDLITLTTDDWSRFQTAFTRWRNDKTPTLKPELLSFALLRALGLLTRSFANTPLFFDVVTDAPNDIDLVGNITVHVADPLGDLTEDDYSIVVPQDPGTFPHKNKISPSVEDIRKVLQPLQGQLWRSQRIVGYLQNYFEDSDYQREPEQEMDLLPTLHVDEASNQPPRVIRIGKVRRIVRIDLMDFKENDAATDLVLRQLLNDLHFRLFVKKQYGKDASDRPLHATTAEGLISFRYLYLHTLSGIDQEPHFSLSRYEAYIAGLARLGFSLTVGPYDPDTDTLEGAPPSPQPTPDDDDEDDEDEEPKGPLYLRLLLGKKSAASSNENNPESPGPSPSPSPSPGNSPSPSPSPGNSPSPSPSPGSNPSPSPLPVSSPVASPSIASRATKPKRNFIGGELFFKPDQGIKINGIYKRFGLLQTGQGQADLTVRLGSRDEHFIVSGNFAGDNLLFQSLRRRLSIDLNGSSDFEAQRIFFNTKTDERRQFSSVRADFELLSRPNVFSIFLEASGGTVELIQNNQSIGKQRLNNLGFGGSLILKTDEVRPLRSLQLEPAVRFGLGLARNEPAYRVFSLHGVFQQHRDIPARTGFQVAGHFNWASSGTPLFEQPSFGGVESVRGFREDDAVGLRVWSLQNEIRAPVFGLAPDAQGLKKFLRSQLKLAAFLDVGAAHRTTGSVAGLRAGPGAGLRLNFQGVSMKFDLAYGLGNASAGRGRGRFHFSVEAPLPF
jgi:Haemolysin secretion/activation protein ShlB/FhaC/HecB